MNTFLRLILLLSLAAVAGCAHVLPQEALQKVDPLADFARVKENPEAYVGKTLLLGGLIVDVAVDREGSTLEVLRYHLDRWGDPREPDQEGGRFLARTDRFLDPALYQAGRFVTLTGTVTGKETKPLGGAQYTYPVFRIGALYLWDRYDRGYYYPYYRRPYYYRHFYPGPFPPYYDPFFPYYWYW